MCVRQLMSALRRAGLISSIKEHPRPALDIASSSITLLDIYQAMEHEKRLLHLDTHTNPEYNVNICIQLSLPDILRRYQEKNESQNHQSRWLSVIFTLFMEKSGKYPLVCGYFPDFWRTLIEHLIFGTLWSEFETDNSPIWSFYIFAWSLFRLYPRLNKRISSVFLLLPWSGNRWNS